MYLILGLGVSNKAVIEKLRELNKDYIVVLNKDEIANNEENIITYEYLKYLDLTKVKYVIKSPGIPYYNKYLVFLKKKHLKIINEIELTYLLTKRMGYYIGVSGSVGKSSVVTLLYNFIKSKTDNVILAGNIGTPLITYLNKINKNTIIILEISSFQLDDFEKMRLNIALLTNIYDNHLDFYKSKDKYYNSKFRLTNNQTKNDYFIINLDNEITKKYLLKHYFVSGLVDYKSGFSVKDNILYYYKVKMIDLRYFLLKGNHNLDNLKAVVTILNLLNFDINEKVLLKCLPLDYHLQEVKKDNIIIVNDSKSTSTSSLKEAIETYKEQPIILIFGGYNKNLNFSFLAKYKFKKIICFGKLSKDIDDMLKVDLKFEHLKMACYHAFKIAQGGDCILFSPGCASFDEFKDYIERGRTFNRYIEEYYDE